MEKNEIKELMEFISKSNFIEFELEQEGFKLKLVKNAAKAQSNSNNNVPAGSTVEQATGAAVPAALPANEGVTAEAADQAADVFQVTSPMVGTFYRASKPTARPYAQVGDIVKKGQVLCIVEAMKLMNEIESEVAGEIVDVPVSNGQPVEYGEVLFRIRLTSS
ncbi:MAG: acetyl-CoA carboxylase biotin carboxyl carrier protein [Acidobacteriota bacterium]